MSKKSFSASSHPSSPLLPSCLSKLLSNSMNANSPKMRKYKQRRAGISHADLYKNISGKRRHTTSPLLPPDLGTDCLASNSHRGSESHEPNAGLQVVSCVQDDLFYCPPSAGAPCGGLACATLDFFAPCTRRSWVCGQSILFTLHLRELLVRFDLSVRGETSSTVLRN